MPASSASFLYKGTALAHAGFVLHQNKPRFLAPTCATVYVPIQTEVSTHAVTGKYRAFPAIAEL